MNAGRSGPNPERRLDVTPLLDRIGTSFITRNDRITRNLWTTGYQANVLGVYPGTIHRWKRDGIPLRHADAAAIRIGLHPLDIWPEFHADINCTTTTTTTTEASQ